MGDSGIGRSAAHALGFSKHPILMSVNYTSILWNKEKRRYDKGILLFVLTYLIVFYILHGIFQAEATFETLLIRSFGVLAFFLLHVILIIGPMCRLNAAFLPLLYNRRHLGVTMFLTALIHGSFSVIQFHSLGNMNPIRSIFLSNTQYSSLTQFPFQVLGFVALIVLGLMAVTSHDFWLKNLGAKMWKALHMLVYVAYGLIILHVTLGAIQSEKSPLFFSIVFLGFAGVVGLHLAAGIKERKDDKIGTELEDGFLKVCKPDEIEEGRAKIVASNERIAIFKHEGKLSAIHNVCKHQGGPLGEGQILDGCITCPWHGYQYLPSNGQSPPPFTEKVATYDLKLKDAYVWVRIEPNEEGTHVEPLKIPTS